MSGSAALSCRYVTGRPVKYVGAGEKFDALEPFHPERVVSRILGMGDVLSLVEEVERNVDRDKAEKLANKVLEGKGFNFEESREHLTQMQNMGGLANILDKLPVALPGKMSMADVKNKMDDKLVSRMIAIINSMTIKERRAPRLLNGQRRARIARSAGVQPAQVNQLILQYEQMEKLSGGGIKGMMKNFGRKIPGSGMFKR